MLPLLYFYPNLHFAQALQTWQGSRVGIPPSVVRGFDERDVELRGHGQLPLRDPLLGRLGLGG